MTEAVIVIPFFLIVWMSLIFLHEMYDARLSAQTISMGAALRSSYSGCPSTSETEVEDHSGEAEAHSGEGVKIDETSQDWLDKVASEQPFGWTHTSGGCTVTVDGIPAPFGGPTRKVKASQKVMCNMKPKDGLLDLVFSMLMGE